MRKRDTSTSTDSGNADTSGPITPREVLAYAEEAAYVAESLRTWAASFSADTTTPQRLRAVDVTLAIMQKHGQASSAFAKRMTTESLHDAARSLLERR